MQLEKKNNNKNLKKKKKESKQWVYYVSEKEEARTMNRKIRDESKPDSSFWTKKYEMFVTDILKKKK